MRTRIRTLVAAALATAGTLGVLTVAAPPAGAYPVTATLGPGQQVCANDWYSTSAGDGYHFEAALEGSAGAPVDFTLRGIDSYTGQPADEWSPYRATSVSWSYYVAEVTPYPDYRFIQVQWCATNPQSFPVTATVDIPSYSLSYNGG